MKKSLFIILFLMLFIVLYGCSAADTSINDEIGNLIKINVYVNDIKVNTPVYKNNSSPPVDGPDNVGDFVLLKPVCEALGATYKLNDNSISLTYKNDEFIIEKTFFNSTNYWVIEDVVYVSFSSIRYAMDGSLKQDDYRSMYLYTKDFERLDIPSTLEECYAVLDKELDVKTKNAIKNSSIDDLIEYHFGLGTWIRNNWIYPANDRIEKVFLEAGFDHPDDMSQEIIVGYHYYLNGQPYEIKAR